MIRARYLHATAASFLYIASPAQLAALPLQGIGHASVRLDLDFSEHVTDDPDATHEMIARLFLSKHAARYHLDPSRDDLRVSAIHHSLLGTHVVFQQYFEDMEVKHAFITVSIDANKNVYRAYNNITSGPGSKHHDKSAKQKNLLGYSKALDIGWQHLKVHGELQEDPTATLAYVQTNKDTRLAYIVYFAVNKPRGGWEMHIDATSGEVLSIHNTKMERRNSFTLETISNYNGPITPRLKAYEKYFAKKNRDLVTKLNSPVSRKDLANAIGLVFDPDPRTALADDRLKDISPPDAFSRAYVERNLLEVSRDPEGTYYLEGPHVRIEDFEPPTTPPSTNRTGRWGATRGNNSFNDAMTYFHIDQNQRYLQSLGYVGERQLVPFPIITDTDAVGGDDNSMYSAKTKTLTFGHGCVDDNEDADVILHEYGHAIMNSLIDVMEQGDMGAIAEGFSDYWAGSYSLTTRNGKTFNPNHVYSWDGHGEFSPKPECWAGRVLNAISLEYDPTHQYHAHQAIGAFSSDELWSAPVFQSLMTLLDMGIPHEQVDQIMVEALAGLASGVKIPEMARSIVSTAKLLQPSGPHANVFTEKFKAQKIWQEPKPDLGVANIAIVEPGNNGVVDPGETFELTTVLNNYGSATALGVIGTLLADGNLVHVEPASSKAKFADVSILSSEKNPNGFIVNVAPEFVCGQKIGLKLQIENHYDTEPMPVVKDFDFVLQTGIGDWSHTNVAPDLTIPDDNKEGVIAEIPVNVAADAKVTENLQIPINIKHTFLTDLRIEMHSPSGTVLLLKDYAGSRQDDLIGTFPTTLKPDEPFDKLVGEALNGIWKLKVVDHGPGDIGKIVSVGISDVLHFNCE